MKDILLTVRMDTSLHSKIESAMQVLEKDKFIKISKNSYILMALQEKLKRDSHDN